MAKKKKGTKRTTRRRSRIGSVKSDVMDGLKIAGGYALGKVATNLISKVLPADASDTIKEAVNVGVPVVLGIIAPKIIKSDTGKKVGWGLMAHGMVTGLQELKVFDGLGMIAPDAGYRVPKLLAAAMTERDIMNNSNYSAPLLAGIDTRSAAFAS